MSIRPLLCAGLLLAGCTGPPAQSLHLQALQTPAGPGSAQPNLVRGADGSLVLSWLEPAPEGSVLRFSKLRPHGWEPPVSVASGSDWFVNWADIPSVVPITNSLWAAHWLRKRGKSAYAYDVAIALSGNGGATWGGPITPHIDDTLTQHGFVSLFPADNAVGVLWLDGRNMTADSGAMALRAARINADQTLSAEHLVDGFVCDCCQTDVGIGREGPIAVYRGRTQSEIRDIYVTRLVSGSWQDGQPIANDGWKIDGCPVNGPAIDVRGDSVAVAWYTGANDRPRVRLARSFNGGRSFVAPVDVSRIRPMGRVDVVTSDDGSAVVSWMRRSTPSEAELCVREVKADGTIEPVNVVARMSTSRPSGFPRLQRSGDQLILAWTDISGTQSEVRTTRVTFTGD